MFASRALRTISLLPVVATLLAQRSNAQSGQ